MPVGWGGAAKDDIDTLSPWIGYGGACGGTGGIGVRRIANAKWSVRSPDGLKGIRAHIIIGACSRLEAGSEIDAGRTCTKIVSTSLRKACNIPHNDARHNEIDMFF